MLARNQTNQRIPEIEIEKADGFAKPKSLKHPDHLTIAMASVGTSSPVPNRCKKRASNPVFLAIRYVVMFHFSLNVY